MRASLAVLRNSVPAAPVSTRKYSLHKDLKVHRNQSLRRCSATAAADTFGKGFDSATTAHLSMLAGGMLLFNPAHRRAGSEDIPTLTTAASDTSPKRSPRSPEAKPCQHIR